MGVVFGKNCTTGDCDCEGEFTPPEPCYICPCLVGLYKIHILAPSPYLELENVTDPVYQDEFEEDLELLKGYIELNPVPPGVNASDCSGDWYQPCELPPWMPTLYAGYQQSLCGFGPLGEPIIEPAVPFWAVHLDVINLKVYVELEFWANTCGVGFIPTKVGAIRWTFEWATNTCEDVPNLVWDGNAAEIWSKCTTPAYTWTSATDGDMICPIWFGDTSADERLNVINVSTPPELFLDRENCTEDACCAEVGGGPTAAMTVEFDGCQIHATDTSTAGTCGDIVRRLWEIEIWDHEPTPDELSGEDCSYPTKKRTIYGLASAEEEIFTTASVMCGKVYFRITLHVWDGLDCHDSISSTVQSCCVCEQDGDPCEGVPAGILSVEEGAELCEYNLCASITGTSSVCEDSGTPFIQWQLLSGACSFNDACPCEDVLTVGACAASGCSGGLGDGDCVTITLTQSGVLRWRVWDNICGCAGPWNEQILECATCHCCDGTLVQVKVTVSGIVEGNNGPDVDCHDCPDVNREYVMTPILDCRFWYTSVQNGNEPEVNCDSSGGSFSFGTEVLFDIDCSDRGGGVGTRALYLSGTILAGGCTNRWGERAVLAPGDIIPTDCSGIASGCFTSFENNGDCSLASESYCRIDTASFCWELTFA